MLDKNEMKLAMLNSDATSVTKEPPLKSIRNSSPVVCCREQREKITIVETSASNQVSVVSDKHEEEKSLNWLVEIIEKRLNSGKRSDLIEVNRILENAIHWCLVNGFVLVPKDRKLDEKLVVTYLPFTLLPSVLDRAHFKQVFDLQPHINQLIYNLANAPKFLQRAFEDMIELDGFLSSLWRTYERSLEHGYNQKINLTILRTDYMLHTCEEATGEMKKKRTCMKQVEVNTIAAGFGYVGGRASQLHDEILHWFGLDRHLAHMRTANYPLATLAKGFAAAWRLYSTAYPPPSSKSLPPIVLFIVLDYEINIADQRHLEYEIRRQEAGIEVVRCTLADLNELGILSEDKTLFYDGREVALVYFRAGYDPSHFKSENEWNALLKIELSKAVRCPTLGTFLSGMKKIQEFISYEENLVEICNRNVEVAQLLKATFVNFFKLNSKENIEKVYKNPENYVLKPQREGGGNNLYNSQIKEYLAKVMEQEEKQEKNGANHNHNNSSSNGSSVESAESSIPSKELFIVMDVIKPISSENYIISPKSQQTCSDVEKKLVKTRITNELGIFGVLVRNGDEVIMNETAGYCLRSKPEYENESGVMCGSGALDSLLLVD